MENIEEKIDAFLRNRIKEKGKLLGIEFEDQEISDDFSLTGSGVFDSIEFMGLIDEVETLFKVEAEFQDVEPTIFTTFRGFIKSMI
jgi:acyl carrier protein